MADRLTFGLAPREMPEPGNLRAAAQATGMGRAYTARVGGKPFLMYSRWFFRLGSNRIDATAVFRPPGPV
jgi:hypothetical protein